MLPSPTPPKEEMRPCTSLESTLPSRSFEFCRTIDCSMPATSAAASLSNCARETLAPSGNSRTIFFATAMTAQFAGRSTSSASIARIPASISATESARFPVVSQDSKRARVSMPPGCTALRTAWWFSGDRSQRACDPPPALCSRVERSERVLRSKRYRMGTEFGTCKFGTLSSGTWSKAAIKERMVFACATTTTVRSRRVGSASSKSVGEMLSRKHSSTRRWQSARLSPVGAGGGRHSGWSASSGGGLPCMLRRQPRIDSSPCAASSPASSFR
mmetsp:Transcript_30977/g.92540  ORF Transcript_30977/g.92540 Transcript_30977/m.92540 type:complete len:273 (+) Transcript_30977:135-953(+)